MVTVLGLALLGSSSNAALIIGSSYSATIKPTGSYLDDGGDPTAPGKPDDASILSRFAH